MNTTTDSGDDELIAAFMKAFQDSSDPPQTLEDYCHQHPYRAADFREAAALHNGLQRAAPVPVRSRPRLTEGEMLGDFRIVRHLADGGMGEVYEAEQICLSKRRVALKVIRRGHVSPDARARFDRERDVLTKMHQTHIVPVYSAGEREGLQYFAMQYIDGATLDHVVRFLRTHPGCTPATPSLAKLVDSVVIPAEAPATRDPIAAGASAPGAKPVELSAEYVRSVALSLADIAEALDAVHAADFLHRDIKPSNLMVERSGKCWVIDFGLAGVVEGGGTTVAASDDPALTATGALMGTYPYMAPEQFENETGRRSDVWSLGVTLYELLALRRPFDGATPAEYHRQAREQEPPPLRDLCRHLPRDLEVICEKAMRKSPTDRFTTAGEFADDLRRWLRSEPTRSNPPWVGKRVSLCAKRNPAWAVAAVTACLALLTIGGLWIALEQRNRTLEWQELTHRTEVAEQDQRITAEKLQSRQRAIAVGKYIKTASMDRVYGWRDRYWQQGQDYAIDGREPELRDALVGLLHGIDAKPDAGFVEKSASYLAFDAPGKRLIMAGIEEPQTKVVSPTRIRDLVSGVVTVSPNQATGPVAWRGSVPVQVHPPNWTWPSFRFWNLDANSLLEEFALPGDPTIKPLTPASGMNQMGYALSADGLHLAAIAEDGRIVLWKSGQKAPRQILSRPGLLPEEAILSLALSDDGSRIAAGSSGGQVWYWTVESKTITRVKRLAFSPIYSLAFGRQRDVPSASWQLAAGDRDGNLAIWDLTLHERIMLNHKSHHELLALAFSPDGVFLYSTGRDDARCWEVLSGREKLLINGIGNRMPALAVSPRGDCFATASVAQFGDPGLVSLIHREPGRGVQELRGLAGPPARTAITPDGRRAAGLTNTWQLGVWDVPSGELLVRLVCPQGAYADHADIRLTDDGRYLLLVSGTEAQRWELPEQPGQPAILTELWPLNHGFTSRIGLTADNRILVGRYEASSGKKYPSSGVLPIDDPRCVRIYELQPRGKVNVIARHDDHAWHIYQLHAVPDGSCFISEGLTTREKSSQSIQAYGGRDGSKLWSIPVPNLKAERCVSLDCTGTVMQYSPQSDVAFQRRLPFDGTNDAPANPNWTPTYCNLYQLQGSDRGLSVILTSENEPFLRFGPEERIGIQPVRFTPDGRNLIWGLEDGTFLVGDLERINAMLKPLGLNRK